jgi:hypothetical protein
MSPLESVDFHRGEFVESADKKLLIPSHRIDHIEIHP